MTKARTALVTGASRGIGAAIALGLAARGYDVALNDIDRQKTKLEGVAAQIRAAGQRALCLYADVSDKAQVEAMVAQARADLGEIDAVVNNAGILISGPVDGLPEQVWDAVMDGSSYPR